MQHECRNVYSVFSLWRGTVPTIQINRCSVGVAFTVRIIRIYCGAAGQIGILDFGRCSRLKNKFGSVKSRKVVPPVGWRMCRRLFIDRAVCVLYARILYIRNTRRATGGGVYGEIGDDDDDGGAITALWFPVYIFVILFIVLCSRTSAVEEACIIKRQSTDRTARIVRVQRGGQWRWRQHGRRTRSSSWPGGFQNARPLYRVTLRLQIITIKCTSRRRRDGVCVVSVRAKGLIYSLCYFLRSIRTKTIGDGDRQTIFTLRITMSTGRSTMIIIAHTVWHKNPNWI